MGFRVQIQQQSFDSETVARVRKCSDFRVEGTTISRLTGSTYIDRAGLGVVLLS